MNLTQALTSALATVAEPVVTDYRLGVILHGLYLAREYEGRKIIRLKSKKAGATEFARHLGELVGLGILIPQPHLPATAFKILGRPQAEAPEIACAIDPFCCVSHLSAMAYHGLTDRIPHRLFLSSLPPKEWRTEARKVMEADLGDEVESYINAGLPTPVKPRIRKIDRVEVHELNTKTRGAYLKMAGRTLRVSKIGRVFLEMLRNPELCGGLRHVIGVYEEHAEKYRAVVVNEIDRNGEPIDKVRAGYILEERMKLSDPTIEQWARFAQRGGSRKLDASAGYFHEWSEKWMLSLNLP